MYLFYLFFCFVLYFFLNILLVQSQFFLIMFLDGGCDFKGKCVFFNGQNKWKFGFRMVDRNRYKLCNFC